MNKLQQVLPAIVLALFIAGCGQDESSPATPAEDEAVTATPETGEPVTPAGEADGDEEETIEVVAESAAEVTSGEDEEIVLAQADAAPVKVDYKYREGEHFQRLVPSQPTIGGADKVEVAEFFWYGCPHCFDFEPLISQWSANTPANVRFVRVPAMWNQVVQKHAQLFYTAEILARNGMIDDVDAFHRAVFEELHNRGNQLLSDQAIQRMFARFNVSQDDFQKTWASFEVAQRLRIAADLARRYSIASVPTFVVNGKYRTDEGEAGGKTQTFEVIDELIARESAR